MIELNDECWTDEQLPFLRLNISGSVGFILFRVYYYVVEVGMMTTITMRLVTTIDCNAVDPCRLYPPPSQACLVAAPENTRFFRSDLDRCRYRDSLQMQSGMW